MIIEKCPICNYNLREITDRKGFLVDFWCDKCGRSWCLEDLKIIENQKKLDQFI